MTSAGAIGPGSTGSLSQIQGESQHPTKEVEEQNQPPQLTEQERLENQKKLEELVKAFQDQSQNGAPLPEAPEFEIPEGLKHLFKAPLNKELLERDYNIWFRAMRIAGTIYSQSALQFQGITAATATIGLVAGLCITQYSQMLIGLTTLAFSTLSTIRNLSSIFIGSDSWAERKQQWRGASEQSSYLKAFAMRVSVLTGTSSIGQRIANIFKAAIALYISRTGYDVLFGIKDNWWTKYPVYAINFSRDKALPIVTTLAGGGIAYFGMMLAWTMNSKGIQRLGKEFSGFNEDLTFSGELERLLYISDEEYYQNLAQAMNFESYEQLQKERAEYKLDILHQVRMRKYPGETQIELTPFEDLKTMDSESPECALKPVVAQLIVLQQQKATVVESYQKLVQANQLIQAQKLLTETLKPLLFKVEFLKQTVLDPSRPAMGNIAPDGSSYFSLMSLLTGSEIKWDLKASDPRTIESEAADLLINEAAIQKIVYHAQAKEVVLKQQLAGQRA